MDSKFSRLKYSVNSITKNIVLTPYFILYVYTFFLKLGYENGSQIDR